MKKQRVILVFFLALLLSAPLRGIKAEAGQQAGYNRSVEKYIIPDVSLVNQDGKKVRLREFLNTAKPVIVDFIYTTCTTICPLLSANFTNFQERLGSEAAKVQLLSISIDPEHDTPKVMKAYLKRFYAKYGWAYLNGSREAMSQVLRTFNADSSYDKMAHSPLVLIKAPSSDQWLRFEGLIGTSTLIEEYKKIRKS